MKRFALLFASLVLSAVLMGCGEEATPPAGTPGTGPDTGPATEGLAKKDRERMFKAQEEAVAKKAAGVKK
jgi:hypothetical protein